VTLCFREPSYALGVSHTCTTNAPGQFRVVVSQRDFAMAENSGRQSRRHPNYAVKLTPDKQDEVVNLMIKRARFMATQPGFVSIALHRSKDGSHVVNYVQ
jgi:hypothetical protein